MNTLGHYERAVLHLLFEFRFKERFNQHWLLQRHGYATPAKVRAGYMPLAEAA